MGEIVSMRRLLTFHKDGMVTRASWISANHVVAKCPISILACFSAHHSCKECLFELLNSSCQLKPSRFILFGPHPLYYYPLSNIPLFPRHYQVISCFWNSQIQQPTSRLVADDRKENMPVGDLGLSPRCEWVCERCVPAVPVWRTPYQRSSGSSGRINKQKVWYIFFFFNVSMYTANDWKKIKPQGTWTSQTEAHA